MDLEQLFYILSIAFFISFWLIVLVAAVVLYQVYRQFIELKQSLGVKALAMLATTRSPTLALIILALAKGWQMFRKKRKEKYE